MGFLELTEDLPQRLPAYLNSFDVVVVGGFVVVFDHIVVVVVGGFVVVFDHIVDVVVGGFVVVFDHIVVVIVVVVQHI